MRWKVFIENENGKAKIFKSVLLELTSILAWFFFFLKRRDLILRSWNLTVKYLGYYIWNHFNLSDQTIDTFEFSNFFV